MCSRQTLNKSDRWPQTNLVEHSTKSKKEKEITISEAKLSN